MLNATLGVKLYALCYTWSEASCSLLYKEWSDMFIALHDMKHHALCYTWSEAYCSFLYME